jgi:hypothetical protein
MRRTRARERFSKFAVRPQVPRGFRTGQHPRGIELKTRRPVAGFHHRVSPSSAVTKFEPADPDPVSKSLLV